MTDPIKPSDPNQKNSGGGNRKRPYLGLASMLAWAVLLVVMLFSCQSNTKTEEVDYSTFYKWVENGSVEEVELSSGVYSFTLKADSPGMAEYIEMRNEANRQSGWLQMIGGDITPSQAGETTSAVPGSSRAGSW